MQGHFRRRWICSIFSNFLWEKKEKRKPQLTVTFNYFSLAPNHSPLIEKDFMTRSKQVLRPEAVDSFLLPPARRRYLEYPWYKLLYSVINMNAAITELEITSKRIKFYTFCCLCGNIFRLGVVALKAFKRLIELCCIWQKRDRRT